MTTKESLDEEGYRLVPVRQDRGVKCGKCSMKFDYGKAYGFICQHGQKCPLSPMPTIGFAP